MKTGIIGAGVAGLATAVRMASRGHEVQVFEANDYPGGKLSSFTDGDYRFDAGPSLFTMPEYVEALFKIAKRDIRDYFDYERLEVVCNYFWEDGTQLSASADQHEFANEVERVLGVPASRVERAFSESEKKYKLTGKTFLEHSLHLPGTR
ncbi:MAG: FAD-dependent oxidoreductase, partial [Bacteroidota bacterium]